MVGRRVGNAKKKARGGADGSKSRARSGRSGSGAGSPSSPSCPPTLDSIKGYLADGVNVARMEKCQIVWAKVGSFPLWPSQLMVEEAVEYTALPKSGGKKRDCSMFPVMFFGDSARVAWVKEAQLVGWGEGVGRGCMDKGSVKGALRELYGFMTEDLARVGLDLEEEETEEEEEVEEEEEEAHDEELEIEDDDEEAATTAKHRRRKTLIPGWWCPVPEEVEYPWPQPDGSQSEEEEEDPKSLEAMKKERVPTASIRQGRLVLPPSKKERLATLFGKEAFEGKNTFPEYVHVGRNAWTVPRPRQLKADEIEVCNCFPVPMSVDSKRRLGIKDVGPDRDSADASDASPVQATVALPRLIGCGHDCLNRTSFMHCSPKNCPCGDLCTNKPFYKLSTPKLEMMLTKNKGWGVQAAERIEKGTFVVEYAGEVINEAEMSRRMAESRAQGHHHFYMMEMGGGLVIDAMYKGNIARLLNSSCAPNCETQKWHDAATGEVRVGIFALRDIDLGEELCYDYNFEHIIDNSGAKYSCQCGAPNCRGSIDTNLRFGRKDEGRRIEIWWEDDAVYYPGVHAKWDGKRGKTGMSRIDYDDGHVEWIPLYEHKHRWLDESNAALKRKRNTKMIAGQAPEENVGSRIDVWWDEDHCYYAGRMDSYDDATGMAAISYDDGVHEDLKLCEHEYRWLTETEYEQRELQAVVDRAVEEVEQREMASYGSGRPLGKAKPTKQAKQTKQTSASSRKTAATATESLDKPESLAPSGSDTQVVLSGLDQDHDIGTTANTAIVDSVLCSFLRSCSAAELEHVASRFHATPGAETGISDGHVDPDGDETDMARETCSKLLGAVLGAPRREREALSTDVKRRLAEALEGFHANGRPSPQLFEPPLNPGAEQTAGSLHGNGRGGAGRGGSSAASSVSSRGRKRQKKVFGTDFEQEDDPGRITAKSQRGGMSPAKQHPKTTPKLPPTSPGMEAASMLTQMAHSKVVTEDPKPRSKSRSAVRGCGPTPPSTGMPKRTILVAKRLTNSDVTKGRVLLPRAAVEANLSFAVGRAHSLVAKDHEGNSWEFTLQSWANGIETRRVFVLEHAGEFIKYHVLKIEDVIGISTTEDGEFMVEFNTDEVVAAAESQQAARAGQSGVNTSLPAIRPGSINPLVKHNSGRCTRSVHCNKPAGHPGFCMRTPASGRGKKANGRGRGRGQVSRGRGKQIPSLHRRYLRGDYEDQQDGDYDSGESGPDSQPSSARNGRADSDDEIFRRGGTLTPRFPNYDYFGNFKSQYGDSYGGDGMTGAEEKPAAQGQPSNSAPRAPLPKYPASGGPLPPPPELGPGVPPIFVGAPDAVPQYPPQLRSPLRPQIKPTQANMKDANMNAGGPTQQQLKNVPHMGLKDDLIDGMSPHAFQGQRNEWNMFGNEGYSPTVAKFDAHRAPFSSGMPAAPLPLFGGAPPPLVRTSKLAPGAGGGGGGGGGKEKGAAKSDSKGEANATD